MTTNKHDSAIRAQRYLQHILDLCKAFDIGIVVDPTMMPHEAGAGILTGTMRKAVKIVKIIDETTYAVALHEIGHCLSPTGMIPMTEFSPSMQANKNAPSTIRDLMLLLLEEESAWTWAHHYALEWTPLMTQIEELSINTYRDSIRAILGKVPDRW